MYTEEQYYKALALYDKCGSVTKTIIQLGYPARRKTLYNWITRREHLPKERSSFHSVNTPEHPRLPPLGLKLNALHRCFEVGENVQSVSDEIGYSTASIYQWRRKYIEKGRAALMRPLKERGRGPLEEGTPAANEEISRLKEQVRDMQLEVDILKETLDVLKKDPGVDRSSLKNREKAAIIDALKNKYPLPTLLKALHYARSSYFYRKKAEKRSDPYAAKREQIKAIFEENYSCYGYRRIYLELRKHGVRLSEKIVLRLMKQAHLQPRINKRRAYSSYQGEITPAVPNIIARNFHANRPNEKWLTDITEFAIPAGKVYLSPMIDCFDGMPVSWRVGISPNAELVNGMLDDAIERLKAGETPTIYTDRGCHYRWSGHSMGRVQLQRSMSKEGCSLENCACEGFFGRIKNEMSYGIS